MKRAGCTVDQYKTVVGPLTIHRADDDDVDALACGDDDDGPLVCNARTFSWAPRRERNEKPNRGMAVADSKRV